MQNSTGDESRRRKWVRIALVISVCVNLLLIGSAVGIFIRWPHGEYRHADQLFGPAGLGVIAKAFEHEDRERLRKDISSRGLKLDQHRKEANEHFGSLFEAVTADPFSREALDERFREQRERAGLRLQAAHEILADRIQAMSLEERRVFGERLSSRYEWRWKRRNGK